MAEIDSTTSLPNRLEKYRQSIQSAPQPSEHRQVPGIDRSLIDIIERCLSVDPDERLPSVQSVLEALKAREAKSLQPESESTPVPKRQPVRILTKDEIDYRNRKMLGDSK